MCLDKVKQSLISAFPWIVEGGQGLSYHSYNWQEMRRHLPSLSDDDLLHYLPYVLYDLLANHTNDPIDTNGAEFVVMELNAMRSHSLNYYNELSSVFGQSSAEQDYNEDVIRSKRSVSKFRLFNKEQSAAISNWLNLAKTWNDFVIVEDDLNNAVLYWQKRSASPTIT